MYTCVLVHIINVWVYKRSSNDWILKRKKIYFYVYKYLYLSIWSKYIHYVCVFIYVRECTSGNLDELLVNLSIWYN